MHWWGLPVSIGWIAQVIEHWLATTGIAGSNPTQGNSFFNFFFLFFLSFLKNIIQKWSQNALGHLTMIYQRLFFKYMAFWSDMEKIVAFGSVCFQWFPGVKLKNLCFYTFPISFELANFKNHDFDLKMLIIFFWLFLKKRLNLLFLMINVIHYLQ